MGDDGRGDTVMGPGETVYQRAPRCAFRCVRDTVLVARPGRGAVRLDGAASLVWLVLAEPGSRRQAFERIRTRWPALPGDDGGHLDDAIAQLVGAGFAVAVPW